MYTYIIFGKSCACHSLALSIRLVPTKTWRFFPLLPERKSSRPGSRARRKRKLSLSLSLDVLCVRRRRQGDGTGARCGGEIKLGRVKSVRPPPPSRFSLSRGGARMHRLEREEAKLSRCGAAVRPWTWFSRLLPTPRWPTSMPYPISLHCVLWLRADFPFPPPPPPWFLGRFIITI